MNAKIILASSSPRRRQLLANLGVEFEVITSDCDESFDPSLPPPEVVKLLAQRKAEAVFAALPPEVLCQKVIVIGADTVVAYGGKIMGKPVDKADAAETLSRLSGKAHRVYTGLALVGISGGKPITAVDASEAKIFFSEISDAEIMRYVDTGEPLDKAGSYGIQGIAGAFVERIDGDYFGTVGLPLCLLRQMLLRYFGENII